MPETKLHEEGLAAAATALGKVIEWNSDPSFGELEEMADKIVRAYLAAERVYRCKICGGVVNLTDAEKPTAHVGPGRHNA